MIADERRQQLLEFYLPSFRDSGSTPNNFLSLQGLQNKDTGVVVSISKGSKIPGAPYLIMVLSGMKLEGKELGGFEGTHPHSVGFRKEVLKGAAGG
jgi:hypothetical protein